MFKRKEKEEREIVELYVLFKNTKTYNLKLNYNEINRKYINEVAIWFAQRKSETHYLRINDDSDNSTEVVAFNRNEICYIVTKKYKIKV